MTERPKTKKHFEDRKCLACGNFYTPTSGSQKYCPGCGEEAAVVRKRRCDALRRARARGPLPKTSEIAPGCKGCIYWRLIAGVTTYCCHYCLDNCLSRPCKPGKDCTVRTSTKKKGATT